MRLAAITKDSVTEGPGLRLVIWVQGCNKYCPGCQNPETWPYNGGYDESISNIIKTINNYKGNISFCGGEPLDQLSDMIEICSSIDKNIWCYTGYTIEEVLLSDKKELLKYIDVLVEGRFEQDKRSIEISYRGSTNQRLIDAKRTYLEGTIVEYEF